MLCTDASPDHMATSMGRLRGARARARLQTYKEPVDPSLQQEMAQGGLILPGPSCYASYASFAMTRKTGEVYQTDHCGRSADCSRLG